MRFSKFPFVLLLSAILATIFLATAPGCASSEEVQAQRAQAQREKDELDAKAQEADLSVQRMTETLESLRAEKDRLAALADRLEAGSAERTAVETTVSQVVSRLTSLDAAIAEASAASAAARETSNSIADRISRSDEILAGTAPGERNPGSDVGALIGTFVPGAAALAPIVGGLVWRGVRLAKAKSALEGTVTTKSVAIERIVASIEALAEIAPEVRAAIDKNAHVLDAIQTPVGKIEVDLAQAKNAKPVLTVPVAA